VVLVLDPTTNQVVQVQPIEVRDQGQAVEIFKVLFPAVLQELLLLDI
jgi:hypothetical protein